MRLLILLLWSVGAWATTNYVSPTGTAEWANCTVEETPCSLATAGTNAADDTIIVLPGTYYTELAIVGNAVTVECQAGAVFDGSEDMLGTAGVTWTDQGSNVWRRTGATQGAVYGVWLDGLPGIRVEPADPASLGQWASTSGNEVIIWSASDPSTAFTSIRAGVTRDGVSFVGVTGGSITGCAFQNFAQSRGLGAYSGSGNRHWHKQGPLYIKTSSGITVNDVRCDYSHQCVTATEDNSNITIDGVIFRNSGAQTTATQLGTGAVGVHIISDGCEVTNVDYDGQHTRADGNVVVASGQGILSSQITDLDGMISDCNIHGNTIRNFGLFGIFLSDLKSNKIAGYDANIHIYDNDIRDSWTYAEVGESILDADCIGVGGDDGNNYDDDIITGIHAYRNYCENATNAGIHYANYSGKGAKVYSNIIVNGVTDTQSAGNAAIHVRNGALAYNNVVSGVPGLGSGIRCGYQAAHPSAGTSGVTNNIVVNQSNASRWAYLADANSNCTRENNLSFNNVGETSGTWTGDAATVADPKFTGGATPTTANGFRLRADSPARYAGTYLGPLQDHGNRRFKLTPSIGAWEAASGDARKTMTARTNSTAR